MNPIIVTCCSHPDHPGVARLVRTAKAAGFPITVLGPESNRPWRGFPSKLIWLRDHIPNIRQGGYDITIFVDAFDTLVYGSPAELELKFSLLGSGWKALVSTEKACWPDADKALLYPPVAASEWKHVNSGGYLCRTDYLDELLAGCDDQAVVDDQRFLTSKYLADQDVILRDDYCNIFQTMAHCKSWDWQKWEDTFVIVGDRPHNVVTNTCPLFWHANGGGSSSNYHSWLPGFNE